MRRLLLIAVCLAQGCKIALFPIEPPAHVAAEILPVTFEELYPIFLKRKSMSQGDKAALWTKYRGRWIKWEGVVVSITDKGITLKQLLQTTTFDVSLICDTKVAVLRQRFAVGDRVRYNGVLSTYDDIFRTLYLEHGSVSEKVPHGDLGVPVDLGHGVMP